MIRVALAALRIQWRAAPRASALGLGLAIATGAVPALVAWTTKQLLDELARGGAIDHDRAIGLAIAAALIGSTAIVGWHAMHYVDAWIKARITAAVERALFERVLGFTGLAPFEDPAFHGRLRLAADAARSAPQQLATLLEAVVRAAFTAVALFAVVVTVWPPMALVLGGLGALGFGAQLLRVRYELRIREELVHGQRWQDSYRALLLDPRAAKELRLFGAGPAIHGRLLGKLATCARAELRRERIAALVQSGLALLGAAVTALGAVIVVERVASGALALGDVALYTTAVAGIQTAFGVVATQLGDTGPTVALFRSYLDLVDAPAPRSTGRPVPPLRHAIELRDVWFRYAPGAPWVLRGANLTIAAGATTGIVGLNGAGKTTLVKLLARFYEVERGQILWDGIDLCELDAGELRARIAATFQDFMTYDLTAAENIGIGDAGALDDLPRIRRAARHAGIDPALAALPAGYATQLSRVLAADALGEQRTAMLSGGQWQRVAIARALIRDTADLIVLDEPTAGLDPAAEHELHALLRDHARGRTQIVISHRLNGLRGAAVIAVLADGTFTEHGSHDQLMAAGKTYARLFSTQATGYQDPRVTEAP